MVLGKVWIWGHWYKVEYEGLHIYGNCGCYRHHGRSCTLGSLRGSSDKNPIMNMAASRENPNDLAIIPHPEKSASQEMTESITMEFKIKINSQNSRSDKESMYKGKESAPNQNKFTALSELAAKATGIENQVGPNILGESKSPYI